ncbi:hypothetical protein Mapa_009971 [Marchantia paleacea]|nr:hypothetical protein Mapa_009971 [Marchantia paleacea]
MTVKTSQCIQSAEGDTHFPINQGSCYDQPSHNQPHRPDFISTKKILNLSESSSQSWPKETQSEAFSEILRVIMTPRVQSRRAWTRESVEIHKTHK